MGPTSRRAEGSGHRRHLRLQRRGPTRLRPAGHATGALVPLILDQNIRNTRQIATAFQPLVDHPMRYLGGDGPDVAFVPCAREDAMDAGDDQIEKLLDQGWRPQDVALLTTSRHPEQIARQAEGVEAYWDSFWDTDQVFYGHVLGFKGLGDGPSSSWSTTRALSTGRANASTLDCRGPAINWLCVVTRPSSSKLVGLIDSTAWHCLAVPGHHVRHSRLMGGRPPVRCDVVECCECSKPGCKRAAARWVFGEEGAAGGLIRSEGFG